MREEAEGSYFCCKNAGIVRDYTFCDKQQQIEDIERQLGGSSGSLCLPLAPKTMIWIRKFRDNVRNTAGVLEPLQIIRDEKNGEWLYFNAGKRWSQRYRQIPDSLMFELASTKHLGWRWICRFWERWESYDGWEMSPPATEEKLKICNGCWCLKPVEECLTCLDKVSCCKQCRERRGDAVLVRYEEEDDGL